MDNIKFLLPFDGKDIKTYNLNDESYKTVCYVTNMYRTGQMVEVLTNNSTAANTMLAQTVDTPSQCILINSDDMLVDYIVTKKIKPETIKRHSSTYQGLLDNAKNHLVNDVLNKPYPNIDEKEIVILLMGTALNKQLDKEFKNTNDINLKLTYLLNKSSAMISYKYYESLCKKYRDLNPFYNASKHEGHEGNSKYEALLNTYEGRTYTIHYFETVRRIFIWYYEVTSMTDLPEWDSLKEIEYKGEYSFEGYVLNIK